MSGRIRDMEGGVRRGLIVPLVWTAAILLAAVSGHAQVLAPSVSVGAGVGSPGGTASVAVDLAGGGAEAATAQVDILFDSAALSIDAPNDCQIDARLTTHLLSATTPENPAPPEGQTRLRVAILDVVPPVTALGDGPLLSCTFSIAPDAADGIVTLATEGRQVGNTEGGVVCGPGSDPVLDCAGEDGQVSVALPTVTSTPVPPTSTNTPVPPTSTNTPVPPTPTVTDRPTNTRTATPTNTRTATPANTPTATHKSGGGSGCDVASAQTGTPWGGFMLLLPLALIWWRRRLR